MAFNLYPSLFYIHSIMFSTLSLIIKKHFYIINNILLNVVQSKRKNLQIPWVIKTRLTHEKLLALKKMHLQLTRDSALIINIFSVPTLFKFIDGFLLIFCCLHTAITGLKVNIAPLKSTAAKVSMLSMNTALVPITELLSVILICQIISAESIQTAVVLHKLYPTHKRQRDLIEVVRKMFSKFFNFYVCIDFQLNKFFLQARDEKIIFTACGLFYIGSNCIQTVRTENGNKEIIDFLS